MKTFHNHIYCTQGEPEKPFLAVRGRRNFEDDKFFQNNGRDVESPALNDYHRFFGSESESRMNMGECKNGGKIITVLRI